MKFTSVSIIALLLLSLQACSLGAGGESGAGFGVLSFFKGSNSERASLAYSAPGLPVTPLVDMPLVVTPEVRKELNLYLGSNSRFIIESMQRRAQLMPTLRQIFVDEGLPDTLLNVALVESGFKPEVRSYAGAVGMWQFMKSTARLYGLKVSRDLDQRRDPILSTIAAARHLRDLHRRFGDWYLALAAYNAGVGGIERALLRAKTDEFWTLARRRKVKQQTARYVPKIIAASILVKHLEKNLDSDPATCLLELRTQLESRSLIGSPV